MAKNSTIPKLKCGGKKKGGRKMADGGLSYADLSSKFSSMNKLAEKRQLGSGLAPTNNILATNTGKSRNALTPDNNISNITGTATDMISGILDATKKDYTDNRINPMATMKQNASVDVAKDITSGIGKGAAAGAALGPVGALVGGAVGGIATGVKELIGRKKRIEERSKAAKDWSTGWQKQITLASEDAGYEKGGKVNKNVTPAETNKTINTAGIKTSMSVNNNYWVPQTRTNIYHELAKAGKLGNGTDSLTFDAWNKLSPEQTKAYMDKESGFDFTLGDTANPGGIKYWKKEVIGDAPKGKGISKAYYKARGRNEYNQGGQVLTTRMPVSMAQGGKITGSGGPKDDKITKNVEDGSFIVPAENAKKAMDIGREYLGWDDAEQSKRNYPGTQVKVSNGEVLFTPEEVNTLSYQGLDLNSLAPNAKESNKMKSGGWKYDDQADTYYWNPDAEGDDPGAIEWTKQQNNLEDLKKVPIDNLKANSSLPMNKLRGITTKEPTQRAKDSLQPPEGKSFLETLNSFVPDAAGALQIGAAIAGSRKAGAMPDVNVSTALTQLAAEQRKEAQYGLEPGAKTAMISSNERARRNMTNAVVGRGGSAGEVMANLQGILGTTIDKNMGIEIQDAAEKSRKKALYASTIGQVAGQDFDSKKIALTNWMQWQEVNAGLLNAGIANIIGVRKLRAELDAKKKIGNNNVDWDEITG